MKGHIDLFSGIGGFSLACAANNIQTEVFCEYDKLCQTFLQRTYPTIPICPDIREFDGTKWQGRFILTGGVPCQPASRAGKQRGKGDDRWLWPEAIRVISEARPDWVLLENPPGIKDLYEFGVQLKVDGKGNPIGEVGRVAHRTGRSIFNEILEEIEKIGYQVAPPIIIPACAVGSPQLRNRYWIVAHLQGAGRVRAEEHEDGQQDSPTGRGCDPANDNEGDMAHSQSDGCGKNKWKGKDESRSENWQSESEGTMFRNDESSQSYMADTEYRGQERAEQQSTRYSQHDEEDSNFWSNSVWLPCADGKLRRAPDDTFGVAHGLHRSVLAALGNSIVPQVATEVIRAICSASEVNE